MQQSMKAIVVRRYGKGTAQLERVPIPTVRPHDVLVRVAAASINPVDMRTEEGLMRLLLNYHRPFILGSDFSGEVVARGEQVQGYDIGDAVFGRVAKDRIGTFAQYLAVDEHDIARKPQRLDFTQAAALPLVGLTAYQALHDVARVQSGSKVLIQAGSGGVGTVAIQLAKQMGAHVATTTSERNTQLVRSLGSDRVIDYHRERFDEVLADYDMVLDTLGGKQLHRAFTILKPGGVVVSIAGIPDAAFARRYGLSRWKQMLLWIASSRVRAISRRNHARYECLFRRTDGSQLGELADLVDQGKLRPIIDRVVSLEDYRQAFAYSRSGRVQGKIILKIE